MVEVVAGLDHQSDHHAACEDLAHIEIAVGTHSAGIVDGDRCCGTRTNKLRIIEVEKDDKGRYRCLVKNSVGDEFSHEAFLIVSKLVMCNLGNGFIMHECV